MHIKRNHSEIITCGMCDFEAKDIEILDTHTFTCEMYKCNDMECRHGKRRGRADNVRGNF